jgi:O-antigen/teichoic acid export membrane protein
VKLGLFRTAGSYTVANGLNAALPLLLMPVLTRHMSPADYGQLVMFQLLCTFVSSFTGLSIHGAVSRQYFLLDKPQLATYVSNCLLILFASTIGVIVCFIVLAPLIERLAQFPAEWFWAVIAASFFQFLTLTLLSLFQMAGRPLAYGALQIFQTTMNVGLLVWLVVGLKYGWRGGVLAQVIAFALTGAVAIWLLRFEGWLRWRVDPAQMKDALRFGAPLIPHTIGATLIMMTDRAMIANMVGVAEAGIYTVGYQVGLVIALLQNSFNQAWVPWVYAKLMGDRAEDKRAIVRFSYLYFVTIIALVLVLTAIAPYLLKYLVENKFSSAVDYVFWIGLGYAFNGMYKIVSVHIFYRSQTHLLAWVTAFTALLNVVVVFYAIKANGAVGAAKGTAFALLVSLILTWLLSARVQPMPWNIFR